MAGQQNTGFKAWLVGIVIGGLALAAGLVVLGALLPHGANTIGLEIVKAGLQLGVIAIVGGGVASAWKYLESLREKQRLINDYRLNVLHGVTISYNQIKGVRRTLRSLGFNSKVTNPITPDHVTEFHAQMKSLNDAQLTLERIKREIRVRGDAFPEGEALSELLREGEDYVRGVLRDWEKHGVDVVAGKPREVLEPMAKLRGFLESGEEGFEGGIGSKMKLFQERISNLVFGKQ